jgi:hypothetical protein
LVDMVDFLPDPGGKRETRSNSEDRVAQRRRLRIFRQLFAPNSNTSIAKSFSRVDESGGILIR